MTLRLILLVCVVVSASLSLQLLEGKAAASIPLAPGVSERIDLKRLGLSFIPNKGQFPEEVKFAAQAAEYDLFFLSDRIVFNVVSRKVSSDEPADGSDGAPNRKRKAITVPTTSERIELLLSGRRVETQVTGEGLKPGKFNYLKGDEPGSWRSDLETFDRVRYSGVFEGIDLVFYGTRGRIQYDFVVSPGADPTKIRLLTSRNAKARIEASGDLSLKTTIGEILLSRPVSFQRDTLGNRIGIDSKFELSKDQISFRLGSYDRSKELIIDPVLSFSTFIGGSHEDIAYGIKGDSAGNTYVIGSTRSFNFPTTDGKKVVTDTTDVFVTKLNSNGSEVVFSTITGGSGDDSGYDIDVDSSGNIYGVGVGTGFPTRNPLKYYSRIKKTSTGVDNWQNVYGLAVQTTSFAVSTLDPSIVYAGTSRGVYKSTNAGSDWVPVFNGLPNPLPAIDAISVSPLDSNLVIAGRVNRIFKTTDGGANWNAINVSAGTDSFRSITIDKFDQQKVYATKGSLLNRSLDGGLTWSLSNAGLPAEQIVYTVVNHPSIPGYLLAGTGEGVYKSLDSGTTWQRISFGGRSFKILFDVRDASTIWVATLNGLFRGPVDGGFSRVDQSGFFSGSLTAFLQDPNNPTHFYAGGNFAPIRSTDEGVTWVAYNNGIPIESSGFPSRVSSIVFAGTGSESLLTAPVAADPVNLSGFAFKLNPTGDGFFYATHFPADAMALTVDGQGRAHVGGSTIGSGSPLVNPLHTYQGDNDGFVAIIRPDGKEFDFSTYLGGTEDDWLNDIDLDGSGNIYLGGETESPNFPLLAPLRSNFVFQKEAFITKLSPNGGSTIYSTFFGGNKNEGINGITADETGNAYVAGWSASPDLPQGVSPGVQPQQDGIAIEAFAAKINASGSSIFFSTYLGGSLAETAYGIDLTPTGEIAVVGDSTSVDFPTHRAFKTKSPFLKSADSGATWRNNSDGIVMGRLNQTATHPGIPGTMLAATDHGVFRSTDGGEIWVRSNTGVNTQTILDVVFDPNDPAIAYLGASPTVPGVSDGGVYKSTDGGITWTAMNSGIAILQRYIYSVAVDPANSNIVYAGSNGFDVGSPLFKSVNGGQTWNTVPNISNIEDVKIDPTNSSVIYVASSVLPPYLFRSQNAGASWTTIAPTSMGRGRAVALDPQDTSRVFVSADSGVYLSTNRAGTWQPVISGTASYGISLDPFDPSNVFAATHQGIYASTDRGLTWVNRPSGAGHKIVVSVNADTGVRGLVYAGSLPFEDRDAFVVKLAPDGGAFRFSTLLGSTGDPNVGSNVPMPLDYAYAVDASSGSVYTSGYTRMDNFPTTVGAASNSFGGMFDAYVAKFDDSRRITGRVTGSDGQPMDGVTVELIGSTTGLETTGLDGKFKFNHALLGGNFNVAARKVGYTFQPASANLSNLITDPTLNFVAVGSNVIISGNVTQSGQPVAGANISVSGDMVSQQSTAADGSFAISVPANGTFTVAANKPGLIFEPADHQLAGIAQDTQVNFSARAGYLISGQVVSNGVGMVNVPVRLSGPEEKIVSTDANGNFSIGASIGGPYSVTPISPGVSFNPPIENIELLDGPKNLLFQAVHPTFASTSTVVYVGRTTIGSVSNLDIYSLTNGNTQNLSNNQADDRSPVFSPDGQKVAFASDRDGNLELYVMNSDGSNQVRLTTNLAVDDEPTWSPDSRKIAFVRRSGASNSAEIYVISLDGSGEIRLTQNSIFEYSPAWSPDGAEIAFVSEQDGNPEIYAMDSNGGIRRRITNNAIPDRNPAWSPDASWIVYDSGVGTEREIWKIQRSGGSPIRLTDGVDESRSPVFSSDGQQVLFVSLCLSPHLKIVPASGGAQSEFTSCGVSSDEPHWRSIREFPAVAMIRGRLTRNNGRGISVGQVTIQYADGTTKRAMTNLFGYYRIPGVRTGEVLTIIPSGKARVFTPVSHQMLLTSDVSGLNFVSQN